MPASAGMTSLSRTTVCLRRDDAQKKYSGRINTTYLKQQIVAGYSGDIGPTSSVDECVAPAENLLHDVNHWLKENKPELIEEY